MIKEIKIRNAKLFSDLHIKDIPKSAKLIILFGGNGTGKSTILDILNSMQISTSNSMRTHNGRYVFSKNHFEILFHDGPIVRHPSIVSRSSYRYSPIYNHSVSLDEIDKYSTKHVAEIEQETIKNISFLVNKLFIDIDMSLSSVGVNEIPSVSDNIENPNRYFDDIEKLVRKTLNIDIKIGFDYRNRSFYLNASNNSTSQDYHYYEMSSGQLAILDLLLDIYMHSKKESDMGQQYIIYCIDEPENHISIDLQGKLLHELYSFTNTDKVHEMNEMREMHETQLWLATHSIGILNAAIEIWEKNPDDVVFLNLDGHNFEEEGTIKPAKPDNELFTNMFQSTAGDIDEFKSRILPIYCESDSGFDADCYNTIFTNRHPKPEFESISGRDSVKKALEVLEKARLFPKGVIDGDKITEDKKEKLKEKHSGIRFLSRYSIENYLLDDEVLTELCKQRDMPEKAKELIGAKSDLLKGKDEKNDSFKKIRNDFYRLAGEILGERGLGDNSDDFYRHVVSKCFNPCMDVYKELENDIFGKTE